MGVEVQAAAVGMQRRMGTGDSLEPGISAGKGVHRLPGGFEQQVVGDALLSPEQSPQLGRHGEGDQEIHHRQQFGLLPLDPALAVVVLAVGATAMTAGMGNLEAVVAVAAAEHHQVTALTAAAAHGLQGLARRRDACSWLPAPGHPSGSQAEQPARRTGAVAVAPKPAPRCWRGS